MDINVFIEDTGLPDLLAALRTLGVELDAEVRRCSGEDDERTVRWDRIVAEFNPAA